MKQVLMAAVALALGAGVAQAQTPKTVADGDVAVMSRVATAKIEYVHRNYDDVVAALQPVLSAAVYDTMSPRMQYGVVELYARALYALRSWDQAHEAFVSLTASDAATRTDWALRVITARHIGDAEDAALAAQRLRDMSDKDTDNIAA
jgi:hypothetical protein